ncbi:helix-turn-helix domain-containing protein [Microlunatus parietis]|uniref:Excisionase family DNA binding protein n=1 Tax=Microlunatus parietis TaxID=682979 RepID=A0A7Y9I8W1_9ACTN|nr:helix-turn-helix domain-containing protein [Microlunatus parietis]NYE71899.1 excisionase family DNA binding protein [Microlunatus parietis]
MTVETLADESGFGRADRNQSREDARRSAVRKWADRVPSLTIPEAAELCSVSREHLYRLVRTGAFPAVRMQGRYVVPAAAVEQLFKTAAAVAGAVEVAEWAAARQIEGGPR